jgi:uncharacterized protein (DUF58 family)
MDFGTAAREKRDLAVAAVATVGVLTQRVGDRFGGYVLRGERLRRWPARSGRLALYGLLRSLVHEPRSQVPGSGTGQTLDGALAALASGQPRRGLRVVVSDFLEPGDELSWERGVRRLGARHQVLAVEVRDPRESQLPDVGVVQLVDPESGRLLEVDTSRRATREAFEAAARRRQEQVASALRRAGAAHLVLSTDSDWVVDTARFVLGHRRTAHVLHRPRFTVS